MKEVIENRDRLLREQKKLDKLAARMYCKLFYMCDEWERKEVLIQLPNYDKIFKKGK